MRSRLGQEAGAIPADAPCTDAGGGAWGDGGSEEGLVVAAGGEGGSWGGYSADARVQVQGAPRARIVPATRVSEGHWTFRAAGQLCGVARPEVRLVADGARAALLRIPGAPSSCGTEFVEWSGEAPAQQADAGQGVPALRAGPLGDSTRRSTAPEPGQLRLGPTCGVGASNPFWGAVRGSEIPGNLPRGVPIVAWGARLPAPPEPGFIRVRARSPHGLSRGSLPFRPHPLRSLGRSVRLLRPTQCVAAAARRGRERHQRRRREDTWYTRPAIRLVLLTATAPTQQQRAEHRERGHGRCEKSHSFP